MYILRLESPMTDSSGLLVNTWNADALHLWIGLRRGAQLGADRQPPKFPGLQPRGDDRDVQASFGSRLSHVVPVAAWLISARRYMRALRQGAACHNRCVKALRENSSSSGYYLVCRSTLGENDKLRSVPRSVVEAMLRTRGTFGACDSFVDVGVCNGILRMYFVTGARFKTACTFLSTLDYIRGWCAPCLKLCAH